MNRIYPKKIFEKAIEDYLKKDKEEKIKLRENKLKRILKWENKQE